MSATSLAIVVALIGIGGAVAGGVAGAVAAYVLSRRRMSDKEQFLKWRIAFDRPAFKGPYLWHTAKEPFEAAIGSTIQALTTGVLFNRSGVELQRGKAISELNRREWQLEMEEVVRLLRRIRERVRSGAVDAELAVSIDADRDAAIGAMNAIWKRFGIAELPLPTATPDLGE